MNISTNWLNSYIDVKDLDLNLLADKITNCGVNVESVNKKVDATNLVVGHVLSRVDHPNSDHLNVCQVDLGNEKVQIVCGASNVDAGQKVIVSKVGAILPGNFEIKKSNIRGEESNGMICALSELGLEDEIIDGIHVLPDDAPVGKDALEYLGLDDIIYTLDLNPNRKSDCTNHLGFSYEVAAVTGRSVKLPDVSYNESDIDINDKIKLEVETDNCSMYLAKLACEVKIKPTPDFIKERLNSVGIRSINNVVDISNYVMLELGQPLHFFDADKLNGNVKVRMAYDKEEVVTLDNKDRVLSKDDIVITSSDKVVAIAGVMGAKNSEVTSSTKNIMIESAIFTPLKVRYTSLRHDLRSEAAKRYERGLNYEYTIMALNRACHLLEKYADAKICSGKLSYDKVNKTEKIVSVSLEKINSVLGTNMSLDEAKTSFDRLFFDYEVEDEVFTVSIPNRRLDVSIREDLIEEVGRLYGYDKINGIMPTGFIRTGVYEPRCKYRKDISKFIRALGLNEVRTYSIINEDEAKLYNYEEQELVVLKKPISNERTILRSSIIPSLLEVYNYNIARNTKNIKIYEISNVYTKSNGEYKEQMKLSLLLSGDYLINKWQGNRTEVDFYLVKGIVENILKYLGFDKRYKFDINNINSFMHPGISANIRVDNEFIGFLGKINPKVKNKDIYLCEINLEKLFNKKTAKLSFKDANIYPTVKRDVAFLFDKNIVVEDIIKEINRNGNKILSNIEVFDLYEKDGKKSIGFSLYFEDYNKTLTEDEINSAFNNIIDKISNKFNAVLRNK